MIIYIDKEINLDLIEYLKSRFEKYTFTDDILTANIVLFHNFSIEKRKFIIKNKNLKQKYFSVISCNITDYTFYKNIDRLNRIHNIHIITFSIANYNILKKYIEYKKIFILTPSYFSFQKIYHKKYSEICSKYINYDIISPDNPIFSIIDNIDDDIDEFTNYKIYINFFKTNKMLDTYFISKLIRDRVLIISLKSVDYKQELFNKYIIYVDEHEMESKIFDVFANYNKYYNKIYSKINNITIFMDIENNFLLFKNFLLQ